MSEHPTLPPERISTTPQLALFRDLLAGKRYELIELVAQGGMGVVYRARHLLLDRQVAVKFVHLTAPNMRGMFLREGRALASLRHPNVVQVFDLDEVEGVPFMIMELLRGETLEQRLLREGRLALEEVLRIIPEMLAGLGAAHSIDVIHGDIKPANVFLDVSSEERQRVKLIDFGVCGAHGESNVLAGTPGYQAPEYGPGTQHDRRGDLWSLGVTLYESLTGQAPFRGATLEALRADVATRAPAPPSQLVPGLPTEVDDLVLRLLEKDPQLRYGSVEEVFAACKTVLGGVLSITTSMPTEYALVVDGRAGRGAETIAVLEEFGLTGVSAADGHEALALLRDLGSPRIAVVDLGISGPEGFRLLGQLREGADPASTILIATSSVPAFLHTAMGEVGLGVKAAVVAGDAAALRSAVARALVGISTPPRGSSDGPTSLRDALRLHAAERVSTVGGGVTPETLRKLVDDVAHVFHVPVALVSLVLEDRQWFEAHVGLTGELLSRRGTPIGHSFCRHVVESAESLVVGDARAHPAFRDNQLVQDGLVVSYVGAPVVTAAGHVLGTLCLIDSVPRSFSPGDVEDLAVLARRVGGELELHAPRSTEDHADEQEEEEAPSATLDLDADHRVITVSPEFEALFALSAAELAGSSREELFAALAAQFEAPDDFRSRTRVARGGPFMAHGLFRLKPPRSTSVHWLAKPIPVDSRRFRVREWFLVRGAAQTAPSG